MIGEYFTAGSVDLANELADHVLADTAGHPHVVVGPPAWEPTDGGARRWYFIVASGALDGFQTDQIAGEDRAIVERIRAGLLFALLQRRSLVIHDMADELEVARWCASIWPGDKTATILAAIERDRAHSSERRQ